MSTPIWYTHYRNHLKAQGLCVQCGKNEAMEDRVMCGYCNEMVNEQRMEAYRKNRDAGMCTRHGKIKAVPGKVVCNACLERDRERKQKRKRVAR